MKINVKNAIVNAKLITLGLIFNVYPAIGVTIIGTLILAVGSIMYFSGVFEPAVKPDYSYVNLQKCEVTQKYDNRDNEFVVRCKFD